jgi:hypothetical protein
MGENNHAAFLFLHQEQKRCREITSGNVPEILINDIFKKDALIQHAP